MRITSIKIENFRSIESLEFEPNPGLNLVVGENGVGKSSIFIAVQKALSEVANTNIKFNELDRRYNESLLRLKVECNFSLPDEVRNEFLELITIGYTAPDKTMKRLEQLRGLGNHMGIVALWHGVEREHHARLGDLYFKGNLGATRLPISGRTEKWTTLLSDLETSEMSVADAIKSGTEVYEIGNSVEQELGQILLRRFRMFHEYRARPVRTGLNDSLDALSGSDTAGVLFNLKNHVSSEQRSRYSKVQQAFSSLLPSLTFEAVQAGTQVDIQVKEKATDFEIPLENVSAGVGEILTWLTNLVAREGHILVIENPELHLHPHHQRAIYRLIEQAAERNQIFLVTHSPFLVDPADLKCMYRTIQRKEGTILYDFPHNLSRRESASIIEALRDPGQREMLFARAVLLVEGETERAFLPSVGVRVGRDPDVAGVSVISVDGENGYTPYIKMLEGLGIPYRCLRDRGPGGSPPEYQKYFTFLGKEFEDFMIEHGFGDLLDEAKKAVGDNKPRIGRYLGEHISLPDVPKIFIDLLEEVCSITSNISA